MWTRRFWPYFELQKDDFLVWYDPQAKAILQKTKVVDVDRFPYRSKSEVARRIQERFGYNPSRDRDAYLLKKADERGFCLAFKSSHVEWLNLPKPGDFIFPRIAWLRCDDPDAQAWLSPLLAEADGKYAKKLHQSAAQISFYRDEREWKIQQIMQRRGQREFRARLLTAYGGRCCISGCDAEDALEAAHIFPYRGPKSCHVSNGLLLRADLHTLFDLDLIGIEPKSLRLVLSQPLKGTCYGELAGRKLAVPGASDLQPSRAALQKRWESRHS